MSESFLLPLLGGVLIGLANGLHMLTVGRIFGISGFTASLLDRKALTFAGFCVAEV